MEQTPDDIESLVNRFSLDEPLFAHQGPVAEEPHIRLPFRQDGENGVWRRARDTARGEVVVACAGSLHYDRATERAGDVGERHEFRHLLKHLRPVLDEADLSIGSLAAVVAEMYPSVRQVPKDVPAGHYTNARPELLDALRFAGFDCLALAQPHSLDAGVRGLLATEDAVRDHSLIPAGAGRDSAPVLEVNGLRLAVLSHTLDSAHGDRITPEGADRLLRPFVEDRFGEAVRRCREAGAEFIISFLDCHPAGDHRYSLQDRRRAGQRMAELGADYVVCAQQNTLSRYAVHRTSDGRAIPIATSLGKLTGGTLRPNSAVSAVLRITLRRTSTGSIEWEDSHIPISREKSAALGVPVPVPVHDKYPGPKIAAGAQAVQDAVAEKLGDAVALDRSRIVTVNSHYRGQLTPRQMQEILGAEAVGEDTDLDGTAWDTPVRNIALWPDDVAADSAAVVTAGHRVRHLTAKITGAQAVRDGARVAIASAPVPGLPTILVDQPLQAYIRLIEHIRGQYRPLAVAVTGSAGKTTTKDLLGTILTCRFRTLYTVLNGNTLGRVGNALQKLSVDDEVYLQEANEGTPGSAQLLSRIIRPHIAVITSVTDAHLTQMGSLENILAATLEIADHLQPGGTVILNHDSPPLRDVTLDVPSLRYSLEDASADYVATEIRPHGDAVEFTVNSPSGRYEAVINMPGLHNVSNALGAFAAAEIAGVEPHRILAGMSRYRTSQDRQNLVRARGYDIFLDCYNSNLLSLTSAVDTLSAHPTTAGGRRILVMGDMGEQAHLSTANHEIAGRRVSQRPIDILLATGEGSAHTVSAAREGGTTAHHFDDVESLVRAVRDTVRPGDALLFKAAGAAEFTRNVVQPLFGRIA